MDVGCCIRRILLQGCDEGWMGKKNPSARRLLHLPFASSVTTVALRNEEFLNNVLIFMPY